ncbi:pyrroline-5-carboxylate reductase [Rhodococcus sp. NPDC058505]|uniref:pyrroline-5-carboxylate reductase n=1 Tax=unclassified Rhodococcus (in: high G+C Gram-positive bacteria) TaxID=192944 RepID=UPI00366532E2
MTRIAVIGGGRIGEALIAGLVKAGHAPKDLVVAEQHPPRAQELAGQYGIRATTVADAAEGAHVVVVAVKPADVDAVMVALNSIDLDGDVDQLIVSLAAGIPTARYESRLPAGFPVVRVMPNTPMLVGEGVSAIAAGRYATAEHLDTVREILGAVGKVVTVSEPQLDAVTAVSGSGPAYFFLVAEAMIEGGVGLGLTRAVATELVVQTMVGSAAMLDGAGSTANELRADVTSPGGTTAAAIRELERGGVRTAFNDALAAAKQRSAALGAGPE